MPFFPWPRAHEIFNMVVVDGHVGLDPISRTPYGLNRRSPGCANTERRTRWSSASNLIELMHARRSANGVAKEFGLRATTVVKLGAPEPNGRASGSATVQKPCPARAAQCGQTPETGRITAQAAPGPDGKGHPGKGLRAWFSGKSKRASTASTGS